MVIHHLDQRIQSRPSRFGLLVLEQAIPRLTTTELVDQGALPKHSPPPTLGVRSKSRCDSCLAERSTLAFRRYFILRTRRLVTWLAALISKKWLRH
jgi:hypothetical protein